MSYNKTVSYILAIVPLSLSIILFIYSLVNLSILQYNPDILLAESQIVDTYTLTSRNKQVAIAERTYNLDEDISNVAVTETKYIYTFKDSFGSNDDDMYMSKIQYNSSDGKTKESTLVYNKSKYEIADSKASPYWIEFYISIILVAICLFYFSRVKKCCK